MSVLVWIGFILFLKVLCMFNLVCLVLRMCVIFVFVWVVVWSGGVIVVLECGLVVICCLFGGLIE